MFKNKIFLIFVVFSMAATSVFAQEQEETKKYDIMFSISAGNFRGQFTLAGEFRYAREFGPGFFQIAGFANLNGDAKEYGGSIGLGIRGTQPSQQGVHFYLFADSLYSYEKLWLQLRPTVKVGFPWFSLMGFGAFPITRGTVQVNGEDIVAAKYWGGEIDFVPFDWARIYGNMLSIENTYNKYRIGAEVRIPIGAEARFPISFLKYVSLSADWNRVDAGLYSNWTNYQDFRFALNFFLGASKQGFRPNQRIAVPVFYPALVAKEKEKPKPPPEPPVYYDFKVEYHQLPGDVVNPDGPDPWRVRVVITYSSGVEDWFDLDLQKKGPNLFVAELNQVACATWLDNTRVFDFYVDDLQRQFYSPGSKVITFGDTHILECRQTGVRTKLNDIRPNTHKDDGTMARCKILHDSSIDSNPN